MDRAGRVDKDMADMVVADMVVADRVGNRVVGMVPEWALDNN